MDIANKISAFSQLGEKLQKLPLSEKTLLAQRAGRENPWFTPDNVQVALDGAINMLDRTKLEKWTAPYPTDPQTARIVGVVMAGNIPLVGFHDMLSVLIAGHTLQAKRSERDSILPGYVADILVEIEPRFAHRIKWVSQLSGYDAVIATGSNNTSRYFRYYFGKAPHIIRTNRSSCAILTGRETEEELDRLGADIFYHFGLGCRNVSKLYIREGVPLAPLLKSWEKYKNVVQFHRYANNYSYQKTIMLLDKRLFLDGGAALLVESEGLISPISVVYYERYDSKSEAQEKIDAHRSKLQCVVANESSPIGDTPFGAAQYPELWNYPDHVDTLDFIASL